MGISCEIALRWMLQITFHDKSTQATIGHYLNGCWPTSMLPYGVTRPQLDNYNKTWVYEVSKLWYILQGAPFSPKSKPWVQQISGLSELPLKWGHPKPWQITTEKNMVMQMVPGVGKINIQSCPTGKMPFSWVIEWLNLTAFLGTADITVHVVHTSCVSWVKYSLHTYEMYTKTAKIIVRMSWSKFSCLPLGQLDLLRKWQTG